MTKPKIQVHFILIGNFNPIDVTDILHIQPTDTWKVGQTIQNTLLRYKHDGWCVSSKKVASLDLNEPLLPILHTMHPHKEVLTRLYSRFGLKAEIACSIQVEGEQYPVINIADDAIQQISELHAGLDIDIY